MMQTLLQRANDLGLHVGPESPLEKLTITELNQFMGMLSQSYEKHEKSLNQITGILLDDIAPSLGKIEKKLAALENAHSDTGDTAHDTPAKETL